MKRIILHTLPLFAIVCMSAIGCNDKGSIRATVHFGIFKADSALVAPNSFSLVVLEAVNTQELSSLIFFSTITARDTSKRTPEDSIPPWNPSDLVLKGVDPGSYFIEMELLGDDATTWTAYYKSPNSITRNLADATPVTVDDTNMNPAIMFSVPVEPR